MTDNEYYLPNWLGKLVNMCFETQDSDCFIVSVQTRKASKTPSQINMMIIRTCVFWKLFTIWNPFPEHPSYSFIILTYANKASSNQTPGHEVESVTDNETLVLRKGRFKVSSHSTLCMYKKVSLESINCFILGKLFQCGQWVDILKHLSCLFLYFLTLVISLVQRRYE